SQKPGWARTFYDLFQMATQRYQPNKAHHSTGTERFSTCTGVSLFFGKSPDQALTGPLKKASAELRSPATARIKAFSILRRCCRLRWRRLSLLPCRVIPSV